MSTISRRPRVFLSSTIFDFKDLRSAVKYWLEESGFEVLASEFNDFSIAPESNSYDNCLRNIEQADYFLLFIGSRVGGWFDASSKVSITRQEYRCAYEAAQRSGFPKIVTMVRRSVWDAREDRRGLQELLKREGLVDSNTGTGAAIANYSSKLVEDAEAIFSFLTEVGRAAEMKSALIGKNERPPFNWIHQFGDFRDVIDVLRSTIAKHTALRRAAIATNAQHEILSNLRFALSWRETSGGFSFVHKASRSARESIEGGSLDEVNYQRGHIGELMFLALSSNGFTKMSVDNISEAITSGEFLDFERAAGKYVTSVLQQVLIALRDTIRQGQRLEGLPRDDYLVQVIEASKGHSHVRVKNAALAKPIALYDSYENLWNLSRAAMRTMYLDEPATMPEVSRFDFFHRKEPLGPEANLEDIRLWLLNQ